MFRTKFGAWLYSLFHGGERILKDKGGEYFVSQQVDHKDDDPGVTVKRTFGWKGRTEGKDLAFETEKNAYIAQMRFKEMALQHGFEYYETESRAEAIAGILKPVSTVILPNPVIRTFNNAIKTTKTGINTIDDLLAAGTKMPKIKGAAQLSVKGNIDDIFNSLAKRGVLIKPNQIKLHNGTLITKYPS